MVTFMFPFILFYNGPDDITICPSAQKDTIAQNCSNGQFTILVLQGYLMHLHLGN